MKYDLIREVMGKSSHETRVVTFDLQLRNFRWENTNKLKNEYFIAAKTGITPNAGPCLISIFKFGPFESRGCLIDSKTPEVRWKEMATILLWQFDKFLKKNSYGAYDPQIVKEFVHRRK